MEGAVSPLSLQGRGTAAKRQGEGLNGAGYRPSPSQAFGLGPSLSPGGRGVAGARKGPSANGGRAAGASCHGHPGPTTLSLSLLGESLGSGEEPAGPWVLVEGPWRKRRFRRPLPPGPLSRPGRVRTRYALRRCELLYSRMSSRRPFGFGRRTSFRRSPCLAPGDRADSGRRPIWHAEENKSRTVFTRSTEGPKGLERFDRLRLSADRDEGATASLNKGPFR
jgi:hypothetical protein